MGILVKKITGNTRQIGIEERNRRIWGTYRGSVGEKRGDLKEI
jgi:hypothetical protein